MKISENKTRITTNEQPLSIQVQRERIVPKRLYH